MKVLIERGAQPQGLRKLLERMSGDAGVQSVLLLAADGNAWTPADIDDILTGFDKPLFGGVFPQILYADQHLEQGVIALGLPAAPGLKVIRGLSDEAVDFEACVDSEFPEVIEGGTMFVLVDGFSSRISALIDALYNTFGLSMSYLGGGGGSLSLVQKPCVITPNGLLQDAAVLAHLELDSGVGVAHGWEPVSKSLRVTEARGNRAISLDWRPAFEVYREIVEAHAGRAFSDDNFFDIAKAYPLGIAKLGPEVVVRDPIMREEQELVCVGEIPKGGFVQVLHGDQSTLLAAASQALSAAESSRRDGEPTLELFIDCVSRVLFLEDEFGRELSAARRADLPLVGALSIGEIANSSQDYLEFYNKTSVVALI